MRLAFCLILSQEPKEAGIELEGLGMAMKLQPSRRWSDMKVVVVIPDGICLSQTSSNQLTWFRLYRFGLLEDSCSSPYTNLVATPLYSLTIT